MKMAALQHSRICKGCWEQMHLPVPIRGVISAPFRAFGVRPSRMNPNTCTICELMFTKVMRARKITIDATIMFADLRGYTSLSQSQSADAVSGLLDAFYDECASAIWEHDGLLNKTIGDAVMAVFNFPLKREAHARNAVLAARDIQKNWRDRREALVAAHGLTASELGIGIGIHSGELSFGEFGRSHRDLTAIGTVVNTASRAQSVAQADQILVTKTVFERAQPDMKDSHSKHSSSRDSTSRSSFTPPDANPAAACHHRFLPSITVTGTASRSKSSNRRELTPTLGLSKSGVPVDQSGDSE
jgi:adenylate cyclase